MKNTAFWLPWMIGSAFGLLLGATIGPPVYQALGTGMAYAGYGGLRYLIAGGAWGAIFGLTTGLPQALLLRQQLPGTGSAWLSVTVTGWVVGAGTGIWLSETLEDTYAATLYPQAGPVGYALFIILNQSLLILVPSIAVALGGWLVLRRRVPRAGWWAVAQAFSSFVWYLPLSQLGNPSFSIFDAGLALVLGMIECGLLLAWLLERMPHADS